MLRPSVCLAKDRGSEAHDPLAPQAPGFLDIF